MAAIAPRARHPRGALIAGIAGDGIAAAVGINPGDRIAEIDGRALRDILDYLYLTAPELISLRIVKPDGQELAIEVEKDEGEPLGLTLADEIFDDARECLNNCTFCFVRQLPPGLRRSLYLRDDDLRLSVLHGNFITLTNLTAADWERLAEQRVSPLHVSIHTTDDALRRCLLGNPAAPPIMEELRRALSLGIEIHGQIVLLRGVNDCEALGRTLDDLLSLPEPLASLAIVPVGLTRHGPAGMVRHGVTEAENLLRQIASWQPRYQAAGSGLFAADEWYLLAGAKLPAYADYAGFPQLSNGVGMTRLFVREFRRAALGRMTAALERPRRVALATGSLFAPVMHELLAQTVHQTAGLEATVVACTNELFGPTVTVAGLLGGFDVIRSMRPLAATGLDAVIVPAEMFRAAGDLTLDDYTLERLSSELGTPVLAAADARDLVRAVMGKRPSPRASERR